MRYLSIDTDPNTARVSRIGLGTWQFGSREWGYGQSYAGQEAHAIVRRAIELGVTLFDTAEIYGFGRSERILGQAIGEDRESVFLATKIFPLLPVAPVVEQRAVASANRLGTRQLDLYQVHQPNPLVKDGTIMRGMRALQRVGLVSEVGVSNYSLERWRAAEHALGSRVLSNQVRGDGAPAHIIATGIDITERKRLENAILEISADEQRRIGQDLHDGLGQHLTGIAFMTKVQEQKLAEKGLTERLKPPGSSNW